MRLKKNIKHIILCINLIIMLGCANAKEEAIPVIAEFSTQVINNDYSVPVQISVFNFSEGADTYNWTFEGGFPATSTLKNPGTIIYNQAGTYAITLEVSNQDGNTDTTKITVPIDAEITTAFTTEIITDNFPPVEVQLTNNTMGADTFNWTFENGNPETSSSEHPNNVIFNTPGTHTITLEVSNGLETYDEEKTVYVAPNIVADFEYEVAFQDDDFQAPVTLSLINTSISATSYSWTFENSTIAPSVEENPSVTFNDPGTYTITLEATNGKDTQATSTIITVIENTNLRTFENIILGINTAHNNNTIGAFFSTTTRQVYTAENVNDENEALIDLVFYGQDQTFSFNQFVSPSEIVALTTFNEISNATSTKFINNQENCNCTASLTTAQFNAMTNDGLLAQLTITETEEGLADFDNTLVPRIVLFETEDGKKGAIKINNFVPDGTNSYIEATIKVQKE